MPTLAVFQLYYGKDYKILWLL